MEFRQAAKVAAVSLVGLAGIAGWEGMSERVYMDPVGIPTVCTGSTSGLTVRDVGKRVSPLECQWRLDADIKKTEAPLRKCVKAQVTQEQWDALVSLAFNIGSTATCNSTLVRKHNAGDCRGAQAEFGRWVFAKGQRLPGLVTRRAGESEWYGSGCR